MSDINFVADAGKPSLVQYMLLKRPSCICFAFINHESVRCRISDTCRYPTLPLYIHHPPLFGRRYMVYWVCAIKYKDKLYLNSPLWLVLRSTTHDNFLVKSNDHAKHHLVVTNILSLYSSWLNWMHIQKWCWFNICVRNSNTFSQCYLLYKC